MWNRVIWLFILFLLGRHLGFPASPRYLELADSADYFIAHENWPRAENAIIEALRLEPANFSNSLLLANLGLVQANKGEYDKAIASLSLGLNLAPSSTVLLNNRAHTYLLTDSIASATKDLDRSLQIDSLQEWTLQTRAFIYLQDKEPQKALSIFDKMKNEFPENSKVYSGIAAIAEMNDDLGGALTNYKKALDLDPDDEDSRAAMIMVMIKNGEYTEARTAIREGIKRNEENPMFYLLRGYLHRLNYRYPEAEADKKIALAKGLDPTFVSIYIP